MPIRQLSKPPGAKACRTLGWVRQAIRGTLAQTCTQPIYKYHSEEKDRDERQTYQDSTH
jgi:hypothetical protein